MKNSELFDIENKLTALPMLEMNMEKLLNKIKEAEEDVKTLLEKYQSETIDVDRIQSDSFSATLYKLIGKYEGKVNKETQEMLNAKMEYDKAVERVKALNIERAELSKRLFDLYSEKKTYDNELKIREDYIRSNVTGQGFITYMELQKEKEYLAGQLVEVEEAIIAANRVLDTADNAMQHLESSESWATYDIWGGGGILSHLAKYEHIDEAQEQFNRLNYQVQDLEKELRDVNINTAYNSIGIDSTTRAIDFWFDNIFTDLNVRDKIRDDMENVRNLSYEINSVINRLKSNASEIKRKLTHNNEKKNNLIKSTEGN